MATGSFTGYATPLAFGPWVTAIGGLGYAASVRIDVQPVGDTVIFGEVKFFNEAGVKETIQFQGTALFKTGDSLQNIDVRFKGVPTGSGVDGTWQAYSSREMPTNISTGRPASIIRGVRGLSIHIGLNSVDPSHYNNWDGRLKNCENDAKDMESIARSTGFQTTTLLTRDATASNFSRQMALAAETLQPGDFLLLTYAGHGGQIPDVNGDEDDGKDETWVLYDRMLIDDELYSICGKFNAGVRIVMVSDSCHSGTMARDPSYAGINSRAIPDDVIEATYRDYQGIYDSITWGCIGGDRAEMTASIIQISGCQDNQTSGDGTNGNGVFTEKLKQVWDGGSFSGTYFEFCRQIRLRMPPNQTPNFYTVGVKDSSFENQVPFRISSDPIRISQGGSNDHAAASNDVDNLRRAVSLLKDDLCASLDRFTDKARESRCLYPKFPWG
jgi:hypothetical protein